MRCAAVLALALAFPASASAGTASMPLVPGPCDIVCSKYAGQPPATPSFLYDAAPGEANVVALSLSGPTLTVRDAGAVVTVGENCTRVDDHTATCSASEAPSAYRVRLGDGADALAVGRGVGGFGTIDGGPGDDQLGGGEEPDVIHGGGGLDRLSGGGGGDTLFDDDAPTGGDADVLDGGAGLDTADYSSRSAGIRADLAAGTGPDGDALTSIGQVLGGAGDDTLSGTPGDDHLDGGRGADLLSGGAGDDALTGGPGRDILDGGPGSDDLATHDGTDDSVRCGAGGDIVRDSALGTPDSEYGERLPYTLGPDLGDVLALDCERTIFGARRDVDGTAARAAPVRFTKHALVLRTPCACRGSVRASNALFPLGSARFTARSRRVVVHSPQRRFEGVVILRWRSGSRTGAWSVALPGPK